VNQSVSADITVKELLESYPKLLNTFMDMGLMCVGCPAEAFHTLADAAREYRLDLNQLLQVIHTAIGDEHVSSDPPPKKAMEVADIKKNQCDMT